MMSLTFSRWISKTADVVLMHDVPCKKEPIRSSLKKFSSSTIIQVSLLSSHSLRKETGSFQLKMIQRRAYWFRWSWEEACPVCGSWWWPPLLVSPLCTMPISFIQGLPSRPWPLIPPVPHMPEDHSRHTGHERVNLSGLSRPWLLGPHRMHT